MTADNNYGQPFGMMRAFMFDNNQSDVLEFEDGLSLVNWPELIASARDGCDDALGEISLRIRQYLLTVAREHFHQGVSAKFGASDVVQQSLMEAYEGFGQFKGHTEPELRIWVKRIVMNNLIDQSRRFTRTQSRNARREVSLTACATTPDLSQLTGSALMSRREDDVELKQALAKLPARQQRIVELKHRFGYSYPEIAKQLQATEPAVRMLWSRALRQLKNLLAQKPE